MASSVSLWRGVFITVSLVLGPAACQPEREAPAASDSTEAVPATRAEHLARLTQGWLPPPTPPTQDEIAEAEGLYRQAQTAFVKGQLYRAIELLAQSLEANPQVAQSWFELGSLQTELGIPAVGAVSYARAAILEPDAADTYAAMGTTLNKVVSPDALVEALWAFQQAAELDPETATHWESCANLYLQLDRAEEALQAVERALILDPQSGEGNWGKGMALALLNRMDEATPLLERTANDYSDRYATRYQLALALRAIGEKDAARIEFGIYEGLYRREMRLQELAQAIARNPTQPGPFEARIQFNEDEGFAGENMKDLRHLQISFPARANQYQRSLALAHLARGNLRKAQSTVDEFLVREPESIAGLVCRAQIEWARDKHEKAVRTLNKAVSADSTSSENVTLLAWYLAALGKVDEATPWVEQELALPDQSAESLFRLGQASLALGQLEQARDVLLRSEKLNAFHTGVHEALAEVFDKQGQREHEAIQREWVVRIERSDRTAIERLREVASALGRIEQVKQLTVRLEELGDTPDQE